MDEQNNNPLLDIDDAVVYLKLSKSTLARRRVAKLHPRYVKIGNRVFYRKADLDDFINASTVTGESNE